MIAIPFLRPMLCAALIVTLGACAKSQPSIEQTNSTTDAQLATINATTNETDGADQGNDVLMAVPSTGQQMSGPQPPK